MVLNLIGVGTVISTVGVTWNRGTGSPASPAEGVNTSGGWPGLKIGTKIVCSTVSIQNTACICTASALGVDAV